MSSGSEEDDPHTDPNGAQNHPPQMMTNLTEHSKRIQNIPQEIVFDILSRLPVKTLSRFRCVSKPWRSLISEPGFIEKHLHISTTDENYTNHRVIMSSENHGTSFKTCSLYSIYNEPSFDSVEHDFPFMRPPCKDRLVGTCNGLICVRIGDGSRILLWNPTIKQLRVLPDSGIRMFVGADYSPAQNFVHGFGYDKASHDYKVVTILSTLCRGDFKSEVRVYSLRTNSWKRIQDFPNGCPTESQPAKFVSGSLIWSPVCWPDRPVDNPILDLYWKTIALDLASETFQDVPEPACDIDFDRRLGVLRGCLCIMVHGDSGDDVWVMKEYGVRESWTKLIIVPFLEGRSFANSYPYWPLNLSNDDEILMGWKSPLVLYHSKNKTFRYPVIRESSASVGSCVYIESLVSPNPEQMD